MISPVKPMPTENLGQCEFPLSLVPTMTSSTPNDSPKSTVFISGTKPEWLQGGNGESKHD